MSTNQATQNKRRYQIAISFAGPQHDYAKELDALLTGKKVKVFLFDNKRERLAGKYMPVEYEKIFREESDRVVILLSKAYIEETRRYTRIESQAALYAMHDRIAEGIDPALFVIKFDKSELPGYSPGYNYFNSKKESIDSIANIIASIIKANKIKRQQSIASIFTTMGKAIGKLEKCNDIPLAILPIDTLDDYILWEIQNQQHTFYMQLRIEFSDTTPTAIVLSIHPTKPVRFLHIYSAKFYYAANNDLSKRFICENYTLPVTTPEYFPSITVNDWASFFRKILSSYWCE